MAGSSESVSVLFATATEGDELATRLTDAETGTDLQVRTITDTDAAVERSLEGDVDCLVTVHDTAFDGFSLVERVATARDTLPRVLVAEPDEGRASRALDAGATDYVPLAGRDDGAVLAHRVRQAVSRARSETARREIEARFEALTQNTTFAVLTIDADSVVQYASPAIEDLFGYTPSELVGESLTAVMPERFRESHHAAIDRYLSDGERTLDWGWIELPGKHRAGHEVPLGISFGERASEDRQLFTAILRDISDQRERERERERLASAVENAVEGIAVLEDDGTFAYVNQAHADIYGYDEPADMVGVHWTDLYYESEGERVEAEALAAVESDGEWRGEATGKRADGSTFPQELSLTARGEGGLVCVVRDITDRVERRQQLRREQNFTEKVIDALPDIFYVLDEDGTFRRWNDRFAAVTGYTDSEIDGMFATEIIAPADRESIVDAMSSIYQDGATETRRANLLTKAGERIPYEFNGTQLTNPSGDVIGLAGTGRDITTEMLREQRLSVLSRVLRHNVRNRLDVVIGNAELARAADASDDLDGQLAGIIDAAEDLLSASNHAREAETVLREGRPIQTDVDLVAAVETALADVQVPADVELRTELPEQAVVRATEQVPVAISELVANASEHAPAPTITVSVTATGDGRRTVTVADDGPGIPDAEQAVLTADTETQLRHSTGIGLWLVNWIVKASGGVVSFDESETGGSAVTLSFPTAG